MKKKHLKDARFVLQETSILTTLWLSFPLMQDIGIYKARPEGLALAEYNKEVWDLGRSMYQHCHFVNSDHY